MINFNDDENLGQAAEIVEEWSFGEQPIKNMWELRLAAGGHKFSKLCEFKFMSKMKECKRYPEFSIAYVAKLRSKIYRQATFNPSQWYIFKKVSDKQYDVLSKENLFYTYNFDIDKFFKSDYFKSNLSFFINNIQRGLDKYIPEFIETLSTIEEKKEATLYKKSIEEALLIINNERVNNKYYKLFVTQDFKETESLNAEIEGEFKKSGIYADLNVKNIKECDDDFATYEQNACKQFKGAEEQLLNISLCNNDVPDILGVLSNADLISKLRNYNTEAKVAQIIFALAKWLNSNTSDVNVKDMSNDIINIGTACSFEI